jgi:hypothetical protein
MFTPEWVGLDRCDGFALPDRRFLIAFLIAAS